MHQALHALAEANFGLGVFTPTLLLIIVLCIIALVITALNFASLQGVKARMVTQRQQEAFGDRLLLSIGEKLTQAGKENRDALDKLRVDYQTHVTEVAEVKAAHSATMRQVDQVMASYSSLHRLLVEHLMGIALGKKPAPENVDSPLAA